MSIKVNIENQVRQTTVLSWRPLLPLFEAVMNSFQAIREAKRQSKNSGLISIEVMRRTDMLDIDIPAISGFIINDNGIGLDGDNWLSFNTAFSPHKLHRGGKGLGRFTWLKAFDHATVETTFDEDGVLYSRSFVFDINYEADDERGLPKETTQGHAGTKIKLVDLKPQYVDQCPVTSESLIQKLIEHFILVFLEADCPNAILIDLGKKYDLNEIFENDFKAAASSHNFKIASDDFTLHGFRLPSSRATKHKLVYAADQRSVLSDKLADHIPNLSGRLIDEDGRFFSILVLFKATI